MTPIDRRLAERILADGPIPLAAFMEEALYGDSGYYRRERLPIGIGPEHDFVTASALSPLFGRCTARLLGRLDVALGGPAAFLEAGPGNGDHLASLTAALRTAPAAGAGSGARRIFAWDRVARPLPPGVERLDTLDDLGSAGLRGLVFSCEIFDALPVHRLLGRSNGSVGELYVTLHDEGAFVWQEGELSDPGLAALLGGHELEPGQIADLAPGWAPLYRRLADALDEGLLVTVDYGYERDRLLDPRARRHGTLACYRRHRVHRDPFRHVGDQDLTAHVDFTALRQEGEAAGLNTVALLRLAEWLTRLEIFDDLAAAELETRRQASSLLDPGGIGHDLRVLVQGRAMDDRELAAVTGSAVEPFIADPVRP
ncbi:MAG: SAM-dependent methyltransferase [Thermoanaerobaculia bacterium]